MRKRRFELRERPQGSHKPIRSRWFSSAKKALRAGVKSMPVGMMWEVREHKIESLYLGHISSSEKRREYILHFKRYFGRFFMVP